MKQASKIIGTKALGKYFTLLTSPPKPHVFVSLPLQSEVLTPELVDTVVSLCNQLESYLDSTEIDIYDFLPKVELEDVPQPQPDEMDFSLKSTGFSEPESGKDLFQSCCDTKINSSNLPTQDYINDVRDITAFPVTVNSIHDIDTNLWTHGYNSPVTIRAVNFITDIRREMFDNILNARIIEPYNGIDSFRVEYYRDLAHPPLLFSPQDYYTSTAINRVIQLHADFINLMTSTINNINPVDQNFIHSLLCIARNYQYTPQFIIDALSGLSSNSCTLSHMQVLERSLNKII